MSAPAWSLALIDAFLSGRALNFGGAEVPAEVTARLEAARDSGQLGTVPIDRATILDLARERLVSELKAGGHRPACPCECGKAANAAGLASVSRELRAVLAEIEALPRDESDSASGSLAARVAAARGDAP